MNDDWRLRVTLHGHGIVHALSDRLAAGNLEHDLKDKFADRLVVSAEGSDLFCYAGTREQAEGAEAVIQKLAAEHQWELSVELSHWHPTAEEWEDPNAPLPATGDASAAEHAEQIASEHAEEADQGYPDYEVRIETDTHTHARELAARLKAEGIPALLRFRYLLIGAVDEDSAAQLAERIRGLVSEGTAVTVEGTGKSIEDSLPGNPFAVLGGLGG
jgi:hypothetical protein